MIWRTLTLYILIGYHIHWVQFTLIAHSFSHLSLSLSVCTSMYIDTHIFVIPFCVDIRWRRLLFVGRNLNTGQAKSVEINGTKFPCEFSFFLMPSLSVLAGFCVQAVCENPPATHPFTDNNPLCQSVSSAFVRAVLRDLSNFAAFLSLLQLPKYDKWLPVLWPGENYCSWTICYSLGGRRSDKS